MKNYDLSVVINPKTFIAEDREDSRDTVERAEILGFIGDNYQRLFIHFISVTKSRFNPYEYSVIARTMVNETISSFRGTATIRTARIFSDTEFPKYKQGFAISDVILSGDKKQSGADTIKGVLTSNFIIDDKGTFRYNALMFIGDEFKNNQFVGAWKSSKTNISKKCHWGDYRIPGSGDLDTGAAEFSVAEKYIKNGWISYMLELMTPNKAIIRTGGKENKKWWE